MRLCFIIDSGFLPVLSRFKNKEEITKPSSQIKRNKYDIL